MSWREAAEGHVSIHTATANGDIDEESRTAFCYETLSVTVKFIW